MHREQPWAEADFGLHARRRIPPLSYQKTAHFGLDGLFLFIRDVCMRIAFFRFLGVSLRCVQQRVAGLSEQSVDFLCGDRR